MRMWRVGASAYYRSGHYQQALATVDERVATQPDNPEFKNQSLQSPPNDWVLFVGYHHVATGNGDACNRKRCACPDAIELHAV